jgi:hypothetical protein
MWLNSEPCGLICGCMTWFLLFYGMYATSVSQLVNICDTCSVISPFCCQQTGVIIPWLGLSLHGVVQLILFNGISLIALYSHIKGDSSFTVAEHCPCYWNSTYSLHPQRSAVMTTDPGAVPPKARPLADDDQENEYAVTRASCTDPSIPFKKYCRRCKAYKPQRAHHCSICGRCIVKMDHHCP